VAVDIHTALGYRDRFRVIPNGTDLEVFKPDADARHEVRAELNVADGVPVIGMAARFHAQKDHPNFLAAAANLVSTHHPVRLGLRREIARVLNAFDIHTLSSAFGEGFPNVLGEAMATGVPCVVTEIGDSELIVGDTGVAVPPRDPAALANGWRKLLDLPPAAF